jgi:hypothetical protein
MLSVRGACFIPFFMTDLFLDKDLTARAAFEVAYHFLLSENKMDLGLPVLQFLMYANTLCGTTTTREIPDTCHDRVGLADVFDAKVISHRRKKVLFDILPALKPTDGTAGSSAQLGQIATELGNLNSRAAEEKTNRETAREEAKAPKTVTEAYGEHTAEILRRLIGATEVYHDFANAKKGHNKRHLLQAALDLGAISCRSSHKVVASSTHAIDLSRQEFLGSGTDGIGGGGLMLFSLVPPGEPSEAARLASYQETSRANSYDLAEGGTNGSLSPAEVKLIYGGKAFIPTSWREADIQLEAYTVVLCTILGRKHKLTVEYILGMKKYSQMKIKLQDGMANKFGARRAPALLVYYFHLGAEACGFVIFTFHKSPIGPQKQRDLGSGISWE